MELTVFTQNNCRYCGATKNFLNDNEVEFKEINISIEPEYIEKYDLMGAPTVILFDGEEVVAKSTGFEPDVLETFIEQLD